MLIGALATAVTSIRLTLHVLAFLHQRSRSRLGLGIWGSVAGPSSSAALVLGVVLAG